MGTLWRIAYGLLTLKLIIEFNRQLVTQRSDATEVSLTWLGWLIGVSTLFSTLDLLRLNFQLELGPQLNMGAYAASLVIFSVVLLLLILILNQRRAGLETIPGSTIANTAAMTTGTKKVEESAADFQSLFAILDKELQRQRWYCLPRLTLNQLSELSGLSPRDISRCINLVAGISFNDYINQHRIEQIKHALLADTSSNLTDLALAAGFSSKATFNQSFRKATGITPSEFRNTKCAQDAQHQASSRLVSGD